MTKTVPNQNIYTIISPKVVPPFVQIPLSDIEEASKQLSGTAFKLYIYFASNKNGYALEFWPVNIEKRTGVARASIYRALDELRTKGYVVGNNFYSCGKAKYDELIENITRLGLNDSL